MKNKKLVDFSKIPSKPGVYFFKNKQGKVIYVGKALSLKSRLRSYFQKNLPSSKVSQMVQEVASLDFIETQSDFEALLLEAKLIKQYQPKYNTRLKDNKRYLYIAISRSPFPRLYIVRRPELEKDLLDWFGPFPSSQAARSVLRTIRNVFPYCSCRRPRSSCLYVHLGLCPGPEKAKTKKYRQTIEKIRKILNGNISFLVG
ncbi:GIY-YIG nuclease family protein, partial [bacterium]|nr:GIY-YIG nuclease family protein [bacterium]